MLNVIFKYFLNNEQPWIQYSRLFTNLRIHIISLFIQKSMRPELKTLEGDILNPDYLIWVSNGHTFDFLLKPFFLGYSREKSKTGFFHLESPSVSVYNLKWRQNFKFIDFIYATLIVWILYKFRIQVEV